MNIIGPNQNTAAACYRQRVITGCRVPTLPRLSKAFSPTTIAGNGISTLTFTLVNPNDNFDIAGATFTDNLPSGLQVAPFPNASTTCTAATWAPAAGATSLTFTGTIPRGNLGSCTVRVDVTGNIAGTYNNVSGFISSPSTGPNTGPTGFGTASLTVVGPPVIAKSFGVPQITTGNSTSLSFTISNPNVATSLTNVSFFDSLPAGLVVATPNGLTGSCGGGTITATAGSTAVNLTGATLAALGSCTFSLNVTGRPRGRRSTASPSSSTARTAARGEHRHCDGGGE